MVCDKRRVKIIRKKMTKDFKEKIYLNHPIKSSREKNKVTLINHQNEKRF